MNWESWLKWLIGPTGALTLIVGWLLRRRHGSGSWIGRRLNAEKDLIACLEEATNREARFARQEVSAQRELEARDREIGYLMAALERLSASAEQVIETHDAASLATSAPSPSAPSPSPAPSPTSPAKPPRSTNR